MTVKTDFNPEAYLLPCPFSESCLLPKKTDICSFPNYKVCPEYEVKVRKLKPKTI
ncbi:MAG: hypothetical protein GF317_22300 [Candidatus Lokiarchaeota archaeon]|nr:hypothetical protein [Candidatus Lokiarchaeota archaeon]MBD3202193.1 hypothetical protein [Candidatus Lokiarchaeota archaeon]